MTYFVRIKTTGHTWQVTEKQFLVWLQLAEDYPEQDEFECYAEDGETK